MLRFHNLVTFYSIEEGVSLYNNSDVFFAIRPVPNFISGLFVPVLYAQYFKPKDGLYNSGSVPPHVFGSFPLSCNYMDFLFKHYERLGYFSLSNFPSYIDIKNMRFLYGDYNFASLSRNDLNLRLVPISYEFDSKFLGTYNTDWSKVHTLHIFDYYRPDSDFDRFGDVRSDWSFSPPHSVS